MSGAVAVVIPAYNEAATIAAVAEQAARHADRVIVVDDGSTDGTAAQVAPIGRVEVIRHAENRGKAESLRSGLERALAAGAAVVITLDGDGQHDPGEIPRLLEAAREPRDVILAARRDERHAAPRLRRFANGFADFWVSWAAGQWIPDTQSGFRLFPAEVLRRILPACGGYRRFVFESLVLIEAARQGCRVETVAVRTIYPPGARPSHYRATLDTCLIVRAVAWRLIGRGMAPLDLCRALGWLPPRYGACAGESSAARDARTAGLGDRSRWTA